MIFFLGKCNVLLQDFVAGAPRLTIAGDTLELVNQCTYLGSCVTTGVGTGDEVIARIIKARNAFHRLKYLWNRHGLILLSRAASTMQQ